MAKGKKGKQTEKLLLRERKLIKGLAQGLIPTEAARQAGYAATTVNDHLKGIMDRKRVKEAVADIMDRLGLDDENLLKTLKEGLSANKSLTGTAIGTPVPVPVENPVPNGGATVTNFTAVPDYAVRHKFLETALDLKGLTPPKKIDMNTTVETYEERLRRIHGAKGGSGK